MSKVHCEPLKDGLPYSVFAAKYLGDCIYNSRDYASLCIGLVSVAIWAVALFPQVLTNIRTGNVQNQSIWLWILWLSGDLCNIVGCILARQLPTQIAVALVYSSITTVLLIQYIYYSFHSSNRSIQSIMHVINSSNAEQSSPALSIRSSLIVKGFRRHSTDVQTIRRSTESSKRSSSNDLGQTLLSPCFSLLVVLVAMFCSVNAEESSEKDTGYALGWVMACLYFSSRIPQLLKLLVQGKIEGVSITMFILTLTGNITYILSVLVRSVDEIYLVNKLPWIVDAIGTVVQDMLILSISYYLSIQKDVNHHSKHLYDSVDETS